MSKQESHCAQNPEAGVNIRQIKDGRKQASDFYGDPELMHMDYLRVTFCEDTEENRTRFRSMKRWLTGPTPSQMPNKEEKEEEL